MSQTYLTEVTPSRRGASPNAFDLADLLDVLDTYERAFPSPDLLVQDSFVLNAIEVLAYEPLAVDPLHPANWKIGKPNLELEVRLTARGKLAVDALPPEEKTHRSATLWIFNDFEEFPEPPRPGARPRFTCFELELEDLDIELRDPDMKVDPELALRRELVFSSYEYVVRQLARHFKCSVKKGLVCVGPTKRLYIRNMAVTENPVEYANLLGSDKGIRWHTRYLTLCRMEGVSPDELLSFFRLSIAPLKENEQALTLRQYLGKTAPEIPRRSYWSEPPPDDFSDVAPLLGALKVVAYSKAFPPLVDHPSPRIQDMLERVLKKNAPYGIHAFAQLYWTDDADIRKMLREHYPVLLIGELQGPKELVQEIRLLLEDEEVGRERAAPFLEALIPAIQKTWDEFGDIGSFAARMTKLARRCGFREPSELRDWAEANAPAIPEWVSAAKEKDVQRLASARVARKRSRSPESG